MNSIFSHRRKKNRLELQEKLRAIANNDVITEEESRKLMDFCELPWDKKCLEFYKRKDLI